MRYMTAAETATKWQIYVRSVNYHLVAFGS